MTYHLDPEIVGIMAALAKQSAGTAPPARGDWQQLRANGEVGQGYLASLVPAVSGVATTTYHCPAQDGAVIELRWYTRERADDIDTPDSEPTPAVVYAHGGGMVMGTLDLYDEVVSWYVAQTRVPFLSVGYRRAPDEGTGSVLAEDVFAALTWLVVNSEELMVDPSRVAVMGDSGGGAPAAGAAILARDRGMPLAKQILIYPMLDDRNQTPDTARVPHLTWSYDNNFTAWTAVRGDADGPGDVSPITAPARLIDFTGLAPAYLDVGDLDIFRDETISYAQRLALAGVPIELHIHPAVPHGWERFAPNASSAQRAMADRARAVAALNADVHAESCKAQ